MAPGPGKCKVSQARAAGIHSIDNHAVFGDQFGGFTVAAKAVGIISGASRSIGWGPGLAAVVAGARGVHTLGRGNSCRCLCSGRGCLQIPMWCWGPGQAARAGASYGLTGHYRCAHLRLLILSPSTCTAVEASDTGRARARSGQQLDVLTPGEHSGAGQ